MPVTTKNAIELSESDSGPLRLIVALFLFVPLNLATLVIAAPFQVLAVAFWVTLDLVAALFVLVFRAIPRVEGEIFKQLQKFAQSARSLQAKNPAAIVDTAISNIARANWAVPSPAPYRYSG